MIKGRDIGEHWTSWRANIFGGENLVARNFQGWKCGVFRCLTEDSVEFNKEHGEDRGGYIQRRGKDYADVADTHFVDF